MPTQALPFPGSHRTGKSTMSLILSLQIKLRKEKRLSWIMRTLGSRHSISCLEASRCCLHLGQYLGKERAHYRYGKSLGSHSPAQPQVPPHVGLEEGMWEVLSLPCQGQASTVLQSAGIAPCWLMASLPSTQGRPAQHPWPPEATCRPGQLLGNPCCCVGPQAGTQPVASLTTLPREPGLRAW